MVLYSDNPDDAGMLGSIAQSLFNEDQIITYQLYQCPDDLLLPFACFSKEAFLDPNTPNVFAPFKNDVLQICDLIAKHKPKAILWRNLDVFPSLENLIYLQVALDQIPITCYAAFNDLFNQMCGGHLGGASYLLNEKTKLAPNTIYLNQDPVSTAYYYPKHHQVYQYQYNYHYFLLMNFEHQPRTRLIKYALFIIHATNCSILVLPLSCTAYFVNMQNSPYNKQLFIF